MRLTFACGPYDRTQALRDGTIQPEGIELNYLTLQPAEIFWRQLQYQEFDASEMSLSNYTTLVASGNSPFIAIPVFPSRVFRHGYFFVNTDKGIKSGADLKGKRGGVPEYSMTAAVYMRGLLQHEYGVKPSRGRMGAGPRRPARPQAAGRRQAHPGARRHRARRPAGARRDRLHDDGEQSAVVPPRLAECGAAVPELRRAGEGLLPPHEDLSDHAHGGDPARRSTSAIPGWRSVSTRRSAAPRSAATTCLIETGSPKASFAWLQPMIEEEQEIIGEDWYPYGIEQNRPTIEALLQYTHEHGLTDRRVKLEELFAPSTLRDIPLSEGQLV